MEIRCDRCGSIVYVVSPEQIQDGEIEHTFFRCQDCGEAYPICATDAALRRASRNTAGCGRRSAQSR